MDWVALFDENHIEYVTRGPNTKKNNISIKCPWCGDDDESQHLGISLEKDAYGCWRNPEHRGKNPAGLIAALMGCSFTQAKAIAGAYSAVDPETLGQALASLNATSEAPKPSQPHSIKIPPEFRQIVRNGSTERFWKYLWYRGFNFPTKLAEEYSLMCCLTGEWKDRIIIPLMKDNELIGWTGRAITESIKAPRYKTTVGDAIKTIVYNEDELQRGGNLLFVTEGPFDALKLDYYGKHKEVRATCTFGVNVSVSQFAALNELKYGFAKVVILFDKDAVEAAFIVGDWLNGKKVTMGQIPKGFKDPGEMDKKAIDKLIRTYLA